LKSNDSSGHLVTTIVEEENGPMVFILALSLALCG